MHDRNFVTLDGLRAMAAISIVVLHAHRFFGDWSLQSAHLAVDMFFALSGFVLAHAYDRKFASGMTTGQFLVARLVRLYPLYLIGTLLGVVAAVLAIVYRQGALEFTWPTLGFALPFSLFMIPTPAAGSLYPLNGVMWSIFFEILINAVWAVFWRPMQSTKILVLIVVLSAAAVITIVYFEDSTNLGAGWSTFVGGLARVTYSFFAGVLLYRLRDSLLVPTAPPIVLLVLLPALFAAPKYLPLQVCLVLVVFPLMVLAGSKVEPTGLLSSICRAVGSASYAIYAVHKRLYLLIYALLLHLFGIEAEAYAPLSGALFIVALIAGCIILDRWVDVPIRNLITRSIGRQRKAIVS
jgi:peptidoglycan/LPS O-acetylase OafA/YrhL